MPETLLLGTVFWAVPIQVNYYTSHAFATLSHTLTLVYVMALSAWFLCLIFASQIIGQECKGIFDDIEIQFDSTLDGFNVRGTREVESSGDGSGIGISCPTSLKADAFSSVSKSLASSIDECIQSPPNAYYEYKVTPDSSASFTTNSLNDHILYADYFSPDTTHHVTVEATCILCDVQTIELNLEISIENYTLKLFPYGVLTSDESLTDVDDGYTDVSMDVHFPVPVYGNRYRKAYVSSNPKVFRIELCIFLFLHSYS